MRNRFELGLAAATAAWALGYGGLRVWWATGHRPAFAPLGWDLLLVSPWQPVLVCAAALLAVLAMLTAPRRWAPPVGSAVLAATIVVSCPLVLLDLVATVLPGLGLPYDPVSILSRAGYLLGAVLLAVAAIRRTRTLRGACLRCGRTDRSRHVGRVPAWAWLGAYLAVAGCLTRLAAQLAVGLGAGPMQAAPATVAFEVGFLLAGTLLPLATVHRWGRVWPRWLPGLRGHRVPRWLVLGPASVLAAGLLVYFGISLAQLVVDPAGWTTGYDLPLGFFWVAIPAYVLWGLGLAAGTVWYQRRTRPHCRRCGRGAPGPRSAPQHRTGGPGRRSGTSDQGAERLDQQPHAEDREQHRGAVPDETLR
ncbi:hypothetical protein AB0I55_27575 [Actinocatenispora sera]|uniref:hypothetical protein n=1 Tax=Actinocatenispora sera TaxID=390989 RepID=UPI0033E20053